MCFVQILHKQIDAEQQRACPSMLRRGRNTGERIVEMEEHVDLCRQHHLGFLLNRHFDGVRYTAGTAGTPGQGDDGCRHHSGR